MSDRLPVMVPREWATLDRVALPEIARAAQVRPGILHLAINRGELHPLPRLRYNGTAYLTPDDARAVLMAAALALVAGIAFAAALRAVAAGATFPLPVAVAA